MDQLGDGQRLAPEAGDEALVVGEVLGEDLDRDRPLEGQVGRLVDVRHAARTEPVAELVAAREGAGRPSFASSRRLPGPTPPDELSSPSSSTGARSVFQAFAFAFGLRRQLRAVLFGAVFLFRPVGFGFCSFSAFSSASSLRLLPASVGFPLHDFFGARFFAAGDDFVRAARPPSSSACFSSASMPSQRFDLGADLRGGVFGADAVAFVDEQRCTVSRFSLISWRSCPGSSLRVGAAAGGEREPRRRPAQGEQRMGLSEPWGESRQRPGCRICLHLSVTLSDVEAVGEALRQAGGDDRRGGAIDVVGDAVEAGRPSRRVELQPGGARVAVARLADAARVEQPRPAAEVEQRVVARLGAAGVLAVARSAWGRVKKSETWEWPISAIRSAAPRGRRRPARSRARTPRPGRGERRGRGRSLALRRSGPARGGARASGSETFSRVHSTASAAASEKAEMSSSPSTARSWLPTRQTSQRSRTSSVQASGSAP